jgi:antitoxin component of MazEF toxin-antitoxin module
MVKTLVKHGNSWALIIDKPILELLHISPDTPLEVSTSDGRSLTVQPATDDATARQNRLREASAWMHDRYAPAFRRLAGG